MMMVYTKSGDVPGSVVARDRGLKVEGPGRIRVRTVFDLPEISSDAFRPPSGAL